MTWYIAQHGWEWRSQAYKTNAFIFWYLIPGSGILHLEYFTLLQVIVFAILLFSQDGKAFCSVKSLLATLRQRRRNWWCACPEVVATWKVKTDLAALDEIGVWEQYHRNPERSISLFCTTVWLLSQWLLLLLSTFPSSLNDERPQQSY